MEEQIKFISILFELRDKSHLLHLATNSYSEHKALNSFYEDILDLADQFTEIFQGEYGLQQIIIQESSISGIKSIDLLEWFTRHLKDKRELFNQDTHLQNLVDEMSSLTYQTLYKLKYLK